MSDMKNFQSISYPKWSSVCSLRWRLNNNFSNNLSKSLLVLYCPSLSQLFTGNDKLQIVSARQTINLTSQHNLQNLRQFLSVGSGGSLQHTHTRYANMVMMQWPSISYARPQFHSQSLRHDKTVRRLRRVDNEPQSSSRIGRRSIVPRNVRGVKCIAVVAFHKSSLVVMVPNVGHIVGRAVDVKLLFFKRRERRLCEM